VGVAIGSRTQVFNQLTLAEDLVLRLENAFEKFLHVDALHSQSGLWRSRHNARIQQHELLSAGDIEVSSPRRQQSGRKHSAGAQNHPFEEWPGTRNSEGAT
jgi:hypothetical protein